MASYDSDIPYDFDITYDEGTAWILPATGRINIFSSIKTAFGVAIEVPAGRIFYRSSIKSALSAVVLVETRTILMSTSADYYNVQIVRFTGDPVPLEHVEDAQKLEGDAYVDLFQIILSDKSSKLFLKLNKDVFWQGNTYEGTGIKIDGVGNYADDQVSRPKLTLFNPEGIYSALVDRGLLDGATVARYRVLKVHIDADLPVYRRQQWKVSRVASLKSGFIGLELRDMLDGQNFLTPGRMYIPPDFPTVSLQ